MSWRLWRLWPGVTVLAALAGILAVAGSAQSLTSWAADLPNYDSGSPDQSPDYATTIVIHNHDVVDHNVTMVRSSGTATIHVPAGGWKQVMLSGRAETTSRSSSPVVRFDAAPTIEFTYFSSIKMVHTNDAGPVFPEPMLGTEYRIMGYNALGPGWFTIIATEDTSVTFSPTIETRPGAGIPAVPAGGSWSGSLRKGEALTVFAVDPDASGGGSVPPGLVTPPGGWGNSDPPTEGLTGTLITSTRPVAVFSGEQCVTIGVSACDHVSEQQRPVQRAGREVLACVSAHMASRVGEQDLIRVMSLQPGATSVTFDPPVAGPLVLDGAGDVGDVWVDEDVFISADQDIVVAQFIYKNGAQATGDPAYILTSPVGFYTTNHSLYAPPGWIDTIQLAAPVGTLAQINGVQVPVTAEVGSSGHGCLRQEVDDGAHQVSTDLPSSVQLVGLIDYGSYWYETGGDRTPLCLPSGVPLQASGFQAEALGPGWASLRWDGAPVEPWCTVRYEVWREHVTGATAPAMVATVDGTSHQDWGLQPCDEYRWYVVPVMYGAPGLASVPDALSFFGPHCIPPPPPCPEWAPVLDRVIYPFDRVWLKAPVLFARPDMLAEALSSPATGATWNEATQVWDWASNDTFAGTTVRLRLQLSTTDGCQDVMEIEIEVLSTERPTGLLDEDGDGMADSNDNCPGHRSRLTSDADANGLGDVCDVPEPPVSTPTAPEPDQDHDGIPDHADNCMYIANRGQADLDRDGVGDVCDADMDGDRIVQRPAQDNCPQVSNPDQVDSDGDGLGDACDPPSGTASIRASRMDAPRPQVMGTPGDVAGAQGGSRSLLASLGLVSSGLLLTAGVMLLLARRCQ